MNNNACMYLKSKTNSFSLQLSFKHKNIEAGNPTSIYKSDSLQLMQYTVSTLHLSNMNHQHFTISANSA